MPARAANVLPARLLIVEGGVAAPAETALDRLPPWGWQADRPPVQRRVPPPAVVMEFARDCILDVAWLAASGEAAARFSPIERQGDGCRAGRGAGRVAENWLSPRGARVRE
eukprot:scaffold16396_cov115-Isochrysis_galbana.AAC.8